MHMTRAKDMGPTPYLQASFCHEVYKKNIDGEVFYSNGFRLEEERRRGEELPFHMYLPQYFPRSREAIELGFDWDRVPNVVPIGFVARGTGVDLVSHVGTDFQLIVERFKQEGKDIRLVQSNCSSVMKRLNGLLKKYPELGDRGIKLNVYIAGHSLGGLMAAAVTVLLLSWEEHTGSTVMCTTFESPGLSPYYWKLAKDQERSEKFWKDKITNYVAFPNPINMCLPHLGRIIYLDTVGNSIKTSWALRCLFGTISRCVIWSKGLELIVDTQALQKAMKLESLKPFAQVVFDEIPKMVGPKEILGLLSSYVGVEAHEILQQHNMSNILTLFSSEGLGLPHEGVAVEMKTWPSYTSFQDSLKSVIEDIAQFCTPFHPDNAGIFTIGKRRHVLLSRLKKVNGFVPLE